MKKLKQMQQFLKGSMRYYSVALASVILTVLFASTIPLVVRFAIDVVIGGEAVPENGIISAIITPVGGVEGIRSQLWLFLIVLVGITAFQGLFLFLKGKMAAVTAENAAKRMRDRVYGHLTHLPFDWHVKCQTGDIIQRCTSDVETVQGFVSNQFIEAGQTITQVIVVLTIMLSMNVKLTLVSIAIIPLILISTVVFFKKMMKIFSQTDEAEGQLSATLQENLSGVRVVKAFAAQRFEMEKFAEKNEKYRNLTMKIIRLMANFWSASDLLCLLQFVTVIMTGAAWAAKGEITIGTMVAFLSYTGMLIWPIRGLGQMLGFMGQSFVSLGRLFDILDTPTEDYASGSKDAAIRGDIRFENVRFGYEKDKPVLDGLTCHIPKGRTTAILGVTGSGKSSLAHLLLKLYDYESGSIRIDGKELSTLNRSWVRSHVGMVLQEPFLFSRTVRENIRNGSPHAQDVAVEAAAAMACVHHAVLDFEKGYETIVGERGVTLSGGQRQRIAIARTVLRDVPILIFDDSLSAVDTETDAAIRQALKERRKDTTTIIISHRITTLAEADQILVLENGRITESGTHEELIEKEGHYKRVWDLQTALGEGIDHAV